ncbi:hypothetical protein AeMF1_018708 [Aphanomyces euteiches]|nr:hypothetical protein AeMF1_018708 [Aphanomyces euteiches]
MPRGKHLNETERAQILALHKNKINVQQICKYLDRSRNVVVTFLSDPEAYGSAKRSGRPPLLTPLAKRHLIRDACKTGASAKKLKKDLELDVSIRTVQDILHKSPRLEFVKRLATPKLTEEHKIARIKFALGHLEAPPNWRKVIWSDEKKFNLDGPDGWQYYWHDLMRDPEYRFARKFGGPSVMVWAGFSCIGKTKILFLRGNQDSEDYIYTLQDGLFDFAHLHYGNDFLFQQDGASIHRSKVTAKFLEDENVILFDHPALSPDLNPIENLWGILAREVYADGKQYDSLDELKSSIEREWEKIPISTLENLVASMPRRCIGVIQANGGITKY